MILAAHSLQMTAKYFIFMRYFLLLCYSSMCSISTAQTVNVDSLKLLFDESATFSAINAERCQALSSYYTMVNLDSSTYYADKFQSMAVALNDKRLVGISKYLQANILMVKEANVSARALYQEAIDIFISVNDGEKLTKAYSNYAVSLLNENNYAEGRIWYEKALEVAKVRKDLSVLAFIYGNLGVIADQSGDKRKAISHYTESLKFFEQKGDISSMGKMHHNIGAVYSNLEDQAHAISHTKKAFDLYEQAKNLKSRNNALLNLAYYYKEIDSLDQANDYLTLAGATTYPLNPVQVSLFMLIKGQVFEAKGDLISAQTSLDSCVVQARAANSPMNLHNAQATLARIFIAKKEFASALPRAQEALGIAQTMQDAVSINLDQKFVAQAFAGLGNANESVKFYQAYETGRDTLYKQETFQAVRAVEEKFETEKKDAEIKMQRAALIEQRLKLGVALASIFLLLISAGWLLYSRRAQQRQLVLQKDKQQLLQEQNETLEQANATLIERLSSPVHQEQPELEYSKEFITLTNRDKTKLRISDILYVESKGNFVHIYTANGKYSDWQQLSHYENLLSPSSLFMRTHRSYMPNRLHITGRRATEITLSDGTKVPIASTAETKLAVNDWLDKWYALNN
jgi:DNA-binding LytR/AlgR family response regulator